LGQGKRINTGGYEMNIETIVNSMTSEQYAALLDVACPLTEEEKNMSVDELYLELVGV